MTVEYTWDYCRKKVCKRLQKKFKKRFDRYFEFAKPRLWGLSSDAFQFIQLAVNEKPHLWTMAETFEEADLLVDAIESESGKDTAEKWNKEYMNVVGAVEEDEFIQFPWDTKH